MTKMINDEISEAKTWWALICTNSYKYVYINDNILEIQKSSLFNSI